jgi:DUF4097 and DUF4098 domain-containing protein YvlB
MFSQYKSTTRVFILTGMAVPVAFLLMSCCVSDPLHTHGQDGEASASFSHQYPSAGVQTLTVHGINGNITVEGTDDADSMLISGRRLVKAEDDGDADAHLPLLTVEILKTESEIIVHTHQPSQSEGKTYQVDYRIRLPRGMRVNAELTNGETDVMGVYGKVAVSSVNGNVHCADLRSDCTVGLVNGLITCDVRLPLMGSCALNTVNGNVSLAIPDTTSAQLEAKVTHGTVSVSNLEIKNLKSSNTAVSGVLGTGKGSIQLSAVNGNVAVAGSK